jgi:hypothetical protein
MRCSVCGDVLAVASERAGRLCLDLRGLAWLEFPVEDDAVEDGTTP